MEIDYRNFAHTILVLGLFYAVLIYLDTNPGRAPNMNWITMLVVRLIFAKFISTCNTNCNRLCAEGLSSETWGAFRCVPCAVRSYFLIKQEHRPPQIRFDRPGKPQIITVRSGHAKL